VSRPIQQIKALQELKITTDLEHPVQVVIKEKSNVYGHEISEGHLRISIPAPVRVHQHLVQRQQYYTGDA
jgi:hypothetical protein